MQIWKERDPFRQGGLTSIGGCIRFSLENEYELRKLLEFQ
jgi:hypothetical protein